MTTEKGQRAPFPDLVFTDPSGTVWDLRQAIAQGPLLLGIYKSSCASSKQMFPILERVHQRYGAHGLKVLGISQDSPNITSSFARRYGITFPILVEGDDFGTALVHLEGVPTGAAAHVEHAVARAQPEPVEVNGQHGCAPPGTARPCRPRWSPRRPRRSPRPRPAS